VSPARARLAAGLVLLSPFVPMLFQGEEWAASAPFLYFTDHRDPEVGRAVSTGRQAEFAGAGWEGAPDPQDRATVARSKLDWGELQEPTHADMRAWYRELIKARRQVPSLMGGDLGEIRVDCDASAGWLAVRGVDADVVLNLGPEQTVPLADADRSCVVLSSGAVELGPGGLTLAPDTIALVRRPAGHTGPGPASG
jgi:maltooligosyltrehalose trehalohydrolase